MTISRKNVNFKISFQTFQYCPKLHELHPLCETKINEGKCDSLAFLTFWNFHTTIANVKVGNGQRPVKNVFSWKLNHFFFQKSWQFYRGRSEIMKVELSQNWASEGNSWVRIVNKSSRESSGDNGVLEVSFLTLLFDPRKSENLRIVKTFKSLILITFVAFNKRQIGSFLKWIQKKSDVHWEWEKVRLESIIQTTDNRRLLGIATCLQAYFEK